MVFLVAAIFTTTRTPKSQNTVQSPAETPVTKTEVKVEQPNETDVKGATTNTDKEIFYDLKITDANVNPTTIQAFNNYVVVTEKASGKVYVSDTATPKFTLVDTKFPGIDNINNYDGMLSFTDSEGYKIYDFDGKKINQTYKLANVGVANIYLDYLYAVTGDKIMKYTKSAGVLTETLWSQNAQFTGAKSMSLAVSIYLITSDNSIAKYTKGEKATFDITGLTTPLNDPTQILADYDWKYIYIADSGNNRVVVLDENGKFIKEIKASGQTWTGITSISVSPKEDYIYVLSGSRVYRVAL
jgi:DNA-binding beta-propeller fold protein YncE